MVFEFSLFHCSSPVDGPDSSVRLFKPDESDGWIGPKLMEMLSPWSWSGNSSGGTLKLTCCSSVCSDRCLCCSTVASSSNVESRLSTTTTFLRAESQCAIIFRGLFPQRGSREMYLDGWLFSRSTNRPQAASAEAETIQGCHRVTVTARVA